MVDYNFKYIDSIDPTSIVEKVSNISSDLWEEYDYRQKTFHPHRHTQTIPILWDSDFRLTDPNPTKWYSLFQDELQVLKDKVSKFCGEGYIIRCMLAKLKAKKAIVAHTDIGDKDEPKYTRIHVPIITTGKVVFKVGNEYKNMKEGEMWEINNNDKSHSVINGSDIDRVHLILDYITQINTLTHY